MQNPTLWRHLFVAAVAAAVMLLDTAAAVDLTGASATGRFVDREGTVNDRGFVRVGRSPSISAPLPDPTVMPSSVWVFSETSGVTELPLDPSLWRRVRRGYRYRDTDVGSGVRTVSLLEGRGGGTLVIRARGSVLGMQPISEPSEFIEVRLYVGAIEYCARLEPPSAATTTNRPDRLAFRGTASACAVTSNSCELDASSSLDLHVALFSIPLTVSGSMSFTCDSIDPVDMQAACGCAVSLDPVNIIGLGDVCVAQGPGCNAGRLDCGGGLSADVDVVADRNIGSCESSAQCKTQCDDFCASLGPLYGPTVSACDSVCSGGFNGGSRCLNDSQCPGGTCDDGICGCSCSGGPFGSPAAPASLSCEASLAISVELDEDGVCGNVPPSITVGPYCQRLTSATADAFLVDAANVPSVLIGPLTTSGTAPSCPGLVAGTAAVGLVGHGAGFGTSIGDILFETSLSCD